MKKLRDGTCQKKSDGFINRAKNFRVFPDFTMQSHFYQ